MRSALDPDDLRLAAGIAVECLAGAADPDWSWHCAPLDEWDGSIPRYCGR